MALKHSSNSALGETALHVGLIYYQAGIVVLDHSRLNFQGGKDGSLPGQPGVEGFAVDGQTPAQRDMDGLLSVGAFREMRNNACRFLQMMQPATLILQN